MNDLVVNSRITIPANELSVSFARSGGPGGQNVNKVNTKVILRWTPADSTALPEADRDRLVRKLARKLTNEGELVVTSTRFRDQGRNREDARDKLADMIRKALVRPKRRRKTKRSKASQQRRLDSKRKRSETKRNRTSRGDD